VFIQKAASRTLMKGTLVRAVKRNIGWVAETEIERLYRNYLKACAAAGFPLKPPKRPKR
jgi:hypothetical protein